ncbi:MAG: ATPase [Lachnospiraceae bacterium]|nr:ATPase [Lachnospiraceae bacterium]
MKKNLGSLPSGKLVCARNGTRYKWYHADTKKYKYIPKSEKEFAQKLALKTYYSQCLEELENEKKAIESYLSIHNSNVLSDELIKSNEEFKKLLSPSIILMSEELEKWAKAEYQTNLFEKEKCIHKCESGHMVRSKSELLIATILHEYNIPFRYEEMVILGDRTIFPDFTIRHPVTGEIYYWENFGMMEKQEYAKKAFGKLELYNSHGYMPGVNLITTFETKEKSLSPEVIRKIIQDFFM